MKRTKLFRIGPASNRRAMLNEEGMTSLKEGFLLSGTDSKLLELSDTMVEQAVGYMGIPLGLAGPLIIDKTEYLIPMATEEASIIGALSYVGHLLSHGGELTTYATPPLMSTQIFIEKTTSSGDKAVQKILKSEEKIRLFLEPRLLSMKKRGGGWQGLSAQWLESSQTLAVNIQIDVRDSMGANLLTEIAERAAPLLEEISGGKALMGIFTNRSITRTAGAKLKIPIRAFSSKSLNSETTAARMVRACRLSKENTDRAVTHNKGIMNGITALALATGNDTRAIEAAVHSFACEDGTYKGLGNYAVEEEFFHASLEIPLPFAVIGGATNFHPVAQWCLSQLGNPNSTGLSRIAVAVGLVQNIAALRALVSEGIQKGHMILHTRKNKYECG